MEGITTKGPKGREAVQKVLELENERLKLRVLPEMGGKILQIENKATGTRFLKETDQDLTRLSTPASGSAFLPPYASGFDECFPTISASAYRYGDRQLALPDHGELWTQSWEYEQRESGISLQTSGTLLNYRFTKHIYLQGGRIELVYELTNQGEDPFDFLWSSHPLLEVEPGDRLLLPEISEVLLNWSSDPSMGGLGTVHPWPRLLTYNDEVDLGVVQDPGMEFAMKAFTPRLANGKAGLRKKQTGETFMFSFDPEITPYLGIWLCYGGWPEDSEQKEFTVALEPCSGRPDALDKSCEWGEEQRIAPKATKSWELRIDISQSNTRQTVESTREFK